MHRDRNYRITRNGDDEVAVAFDINYSTILSPSLGTMTSARDVNGQSNGRRLVVSRRFEFFFFAVIRRYFIFIFFWYHTARLFEYRRRSNVATGFSSSESVRA